MNMKIPKYIRNIGRHWSSTEEKNLAQLAKQNTPTRVIGLKLGRPEAGVRAKAQELNVSLQPSNRSPYNRKKK